MGEGFTSEDLGISKGSEEISCENLNSIFQMQSGLVLILLESVKVLWKIS